MKKHYGKKIALFPVFMDKSCEYYRGKEKLLFLISAIDLYLATGRKFNYFLIVFTVNDYSKLVLD